MTETILFILLIVNMNEYIHSHLSYDEIIIDQPVQTQRQTRQITRRSKDKPFYIQRKLQSPSKTRQKTKTLTQSNENPEDTSTININVKKENAVNNEEDNQIENIDYGSDFQVYQQQYEESIAHEDSYNRVKEINKSCELAKTRKNNYSQFLPKIEKITPKREYEKNRATQISTRDMTKKKPINVELQRMYISKSTLELREQNKILMRRIEECRKILPVMRKNGDILEEQHKELKKMKMIENKIFDIEYELQLDKNVENKSFSVEVIGENIRSVQKLMEFRDKFRKNRKGKVRFGKNLTYDLAEQKNFSLIQEFSHVRQEILYKKRQQQIYQKKLQQLEERITHYESIIKQLSERQQIGIHEQLKKRKILLQYDIQVRKTQQQQQQCNIMMQISQLNNKVSQVEIETVKINNQLMIVKMKNNVKNEASDIRDSRDKRVSLNFLKKNHIKREPEKQEMIQYNKMEQEKGVGEEPEMQKIIEQQPVEPKKKMQRIFKLFGKRRS